MTKAEIIIQDDAPPVVVNESAAILKMVDRLVAMPDLPVERVEQMLALHEQVRNEQARREFNNAMANAQKSLKIVVVDKKNKQTSSEYASQVALDKIVRPVCADNDLSLTHNTETGAPDGMLRVVCFVSHVGGYERKYMIDMPCDGKGAKGGDVMTKTHAIVSAVTYGKRTLKSMIFDLAIGKDDDGNAAGGGGGYINSKQEEKLRNLITQTKTKIDVFLTCANAETLSDIAAKDFDRLNALLFKKAMGMK